MVSTELGSEPTETQVKTDQLQWVLDLAPKELLSSVKRAHSASLDNGMRRAALASGGFFW